MLGLVEQREQDLERDRRERQRRLARPKRHVFIMHLFTAQSIVRNGTARWRRIDGPGPRGQDAAPCPWPPRDARWDRRRTVAPDVIAIIGGGKIGSHLGARFRAAGLDVRFGVRNPDKPEARAIGATAVPAAVTGATVVVLAVPAEAAVEAARGLGPLAGAILVDCTNPIRWDHGPVWNPPRVEGAPSRRRSRRRCPVCPSSKASITLASRFTRICGFVGWPGRAHVLRRR